MTFLGVSPCTANFHLIIEEENGDTLNDAGYKRERAVSELLNVSFDKHEVSNDEVATTLNASVMAGEGTYDFVLPNATIICLITRSRIIPMILSGTANGHSIKCTA